MTEEVKLRLSSSFYPCALIESCRLNQTETFGGNKKSQKAEIQTSLVMLQLVCGLACLLNGLMDSKYLKHILIDKYSKHPCWYLITEACELRVRPLCWLMWALKKVTTPPYKLFIDPDTETISSSSSSLLSPAVSPWNECDGHRLVRQERQPAAHVEAGGGIQRSYLPDNAKRCRRSPLYLLLSRSVRVKQRQNVMFT